MYKRQDLHPVVFGADGNGRQAHVDGGHFEYPRGCFTVGSIGGVAVPCLSVDQQLRFHTGYQPRDNDRHDVALLHSLVRNDASSRALLLLAQCDTLSAGLARCLRDRYAVSVGRPATETLACSC